MLAARGLHTLPFLSTDGYPLVCAIDSRSRFVAWRPVPIGSDPAAIRGELRSLLDSSDPVSPSE